MDKYYGQFRFTPNISVILVEGVTSDYLPDCRSRCFEVKGKSPEDIYSETGIGEWASRESEKMGKEIARKMNP